jgi:hypothetical protein
MNSSCASSRQSRTDPLSGPSESTGLTEAFGSSVQAAETANPPLAPLHCLMCRRLQHRVVFTESGIDILRCEDCGHVFSSFRADPHYSGYWGADVAPGEHHYWSKARKKMHRDFFQRFVVRRSGRLLDMGSGLGTLMVAKSLLPPSSLLANSWGSRMWSAARFRM